jgi:predicted GNAT superfamily acetyltransferase
MPYVIRNVDSQQEMRSCAEMQREVWGFDTPDIVSADMLEKIHQGGGILLGAFEADGSLIGFVFSFPAFLAGCPIQHSHMLAVRPALRDTGIGQALKLTQRRRAKDLGQALITWTFDPLESKNGYLNLNKLEVVVNRYYVNVYGQETTSELHSGIGTDRFLAEWRVEESENVRLEPNLARAVAVISGTRTRSGWVAPKQHSEVIAAPILSVEVPYEIQALKKADPSLAMEWRVITRLVLPEYLNLGYQVRRLETFEDDQGARSAYLLCNTETEKG